VNEKLTNPGVELVHMQQEDLIAELIAQTVVDDYQSPVKPRHYIELRLGRAREYYQTQIPRCYRWLCFWEVVVTLATVSSAVLAYVDDVRSFAAVAAAVGAAVTSWGAHTDYSARIERYTGTVRSINKLVAWWKSLDDVERASPTQISLLVETGESIISSERQAWLMAGSDRRSEKEMAEGKLVVGPAAFT